MSDFNISATGIIDAMVNLRGWSRSSFRPSIKECPDRLWAFETDRPLLLYFGNQKKFTRVLVNVDTTPHFFKGQNTHAWFDVDTQSFYIHDGPAKDNLTGVKLFDLCKGLEYIDTKFGKPQDATQIVKSYSALKIPAP